MLLATTLELAMLAVMLWSADHRTRVLGGVLFMLYLRYSATRTAAENLADWWNDRNLPPGGPA